MRLHLKDQSGNPVRCDGLSVEARIALGNAAPEQALGVSNVVDSTWKRLQHHQLVSEH